MRIDDSIGWIEGRLIFSGHPLKDVANKLSRYYQVRINIHEEIANLQYTGMVDRETLPGGPPDDLRDLSCKTLHHQYRRGIFPFEGETKIRNEFFNYLNIK